MNLSDTLQYKGYYGSVQYSHEDNILHGKLLGIDSLVSYDGYSLKELQDCFEEAVDDYLEDCKALNIDPEIPYAAEISIKLNPELQERAATLAQSKKMTVNKYIENFLEEQLKLAQ